MRALEHAVRGGAASGREGGTGIRISRPSDAHEREADRFAAAFDVRGGDRASGRAMSGPSGAALPSSLRERFGAALGHDFAAVRVYHDAAADREARRLGAAAFTVGNDVHFRAGLYAPQTERGLRLLSHELAHVRQQHVAGLRVDRRVLSAEELEDMNLQSQSTNPILPLLGSDPVFEKFAELLKRRLGPKVVVRRGTFEEQAEAVASDQSIPMAPGVTKQALDRSQWRPRSPPSGWQTYRSLLKAVDAFASDFGGLPTVNEVVLFDSRFEANSRTGVLERANTGASFGSGQLTLYANVARANVMPEGRSGVPFAGNQAKLAPAGSERQAIERNVAHEFGHGVAEDAHKADPAMMSDFMKEVGWDEFRPATDRTPATSPRLFDVGEPEVRAALRKGTVPPSQYQITIYNWNEGRWIEQPITAYSVTNPGDDFAETIMAFLKAPAILKARSPRRFKFIESHKDRWMSKQKDAAPLLPSSVHPSPPV